MQRQLRCSRIRYFLYELFLVVAWLSATEAGSLEVIHSNEDLLAALRNDEVSLILLLDDLTLGREFDELTEPIAVRRNVTLYGVPGQMPKLDLRFLRSVVELCEGCLFTLENVTIANERRGNGASVDFFLGKPGSTLSLRDAYRLRLACTSTDSTIELIHKDQKRSQQLLSPNGTAEQWIGTNSVSYKGRLFQDMVWLIHFAYDVPLSFIEGKGYTGGYTLLTFNTTRLCQSLVGRHCLAIKNPDACVNEAIDAILAQVDDSGSSHNNQQTASIAAAVSAAAGALLVATLFLFFLRWRRNQQRRQGLPHFSRKPSICKDPSGNPMYFHDSPSNRGYRAYNAAADEEAAAARKGSAPVGNDDEDRHLLDEDAMMNKYLTDTRGWHSTSMSITPNLVTAGDLRIHFGECLGSGSYGRVYKGRWAGRDVAIKVIEHDTLSAPAVEHEAQLMLSLNHPNIVRAFHYITFQQTSSDRHKSSESNAQQQAESANANAGISPQQQRATAQQQQQQGDGCSSASGTTNSNQQQQVEQQIDLQDLPHRGYVYSATPVNATAAAAAAAAAAGSAAAAGHSTGSSSDLVQQQLLCAGISQQQQNAALGPPTPPPMPQQQQQQSDMGHSMNDTINRSGNEVHKGTQPWGASWFSLGVAPLSLSAEDRAAAGAAAAAAGDGGSGTEHADDSADGNNIKQRSRWARHQPPTDRVSNNYAAGGGRPLQDDKKSKTWLVQEYCDSGTLSYYVCMNLPDPFNGRQLLRLLWLLKQAAEGLAELHSRNVVHGDLNARNVLVNSNKGHHDHQNHDLDRDHDGDDHDLDHDERSNLRPTVTAKLADFGLSRVIKQHSTHRTTNTVGTMSHMPPELLRYGRMSPSIDIYSFGVMMWELFTGMPAFLHLHYGQFFELVVLQQARPPLPPDMPPSYAALMTQCWSQQPEQRPTALQLIESLDTLIQAQVQEVAQMQDDDSARQRAAEGASGVAGGGGARQASNQQYHASAVSDGPVPYFGDIHFGNKAV